MLDEAPLIEEKLLGIDGAEIEVEVASDSVYL